MAATRTVRHHPLLRLVARAQGWYYLLGGLWRLLHPSSFEVIAGPKPDQFQTDATAALFSAVGAALLAGTTSAVLARPTRVLAVGAGTAVACIDIKHRRDIRALFRIEGGVELVFAAASAARASSESVVFPQLRDGVRAQNG